MQRGMSSEKHFTVIDNKKPSLLRRFTVTRLETHMTSFISPIERWPDNNYAPKELEYVWNQSPTSHKIITPLHGYKAQDVRVDISRGHVIILLSRDYGMASSIREEYYCEVPIPADAKRNKAYVEITTHFLIVRLDKKQRFFRRAVSTVVNFKNYFALVFRIGLNSNRLDG